MKTNKIFVSAIVCLFCLLIPTSLFAQLDPGPCPDCPIDRGVVMLITAAVGIAVKKFYMHRKPDAATENI